MFVFSYFTHFQPDAVALWSLRSFFVRVPVHILVALWGLPVYLFKELCQNVCLGRPSRYATFLNVMQAFVTLRIFLKSCFLWKLVVYHVLISRKFWFILLDFCVGWRNTSNSITLLQGSCICCTAIVLYIDALVNFRRSHTQNISLRRNEEYCSVFFLIWLYVHLFCQHLWKMSVKCP